MTHFTLIVRQWFLSNTTGMTHFTLTVRHSNSWVTLQGWLFHPDSETMIQGQQYRLISPWQWDTVIQGKRMETHFPVTVRCYDSGATELIHFILTVRHSDSREEDRLMSLWQWDVKILGQQNGLISPWQTQWFRGNMTHFTLTVRNSDSRATSISISLWQWHTVIHGQHDYFTLTVRHSNSGATWLFHHDNKTQQLRGNMT